MDCQTQTIATQQCAILTKQPSYDLKRRTIMSQRKSTYLYYPYAGIAKQGGGEKVSATTAIIIRLDPDLNYLKT
jgi:hypothetical protein